jgi:hypothetical protein
MSLSNALHHLVSKMMTMWICALLYSILNIFLIGSFVTTANLLFHFLGVIDNIY